MKSSVFTTVLLSGLLALPAAASEQEFYGALSIGRSDIDDFDKDTSFSIAGGVQVNQHVAFEAGYSDFGEAKVSNGFSSASYSADAIQLSVLGLLPLSDKAGLTGRFGIDLWDGTIKYTNVPGLGTGSVSEDGTDIYFGFGAYINVVEKAKLYFELQRHDIDDIDVDVVSIGARYFF
jgi:hypothetical protein